MSDSVSWLILILRELLTGADPNLLSFVWVQLEANPAHPEVNFLDTDDETSRQHLQQRAEINLRVVRV